MTGPGLADRERRYQIGEVASMVGLSLRTIRHYEEAGVVVPSGRSPGGFRLYTDADVQRLRNVMGMKPIGFALEEIREVLELLDQATRDDAPPAIWTKLADYSILADERRAKYERRMELAAGFTERLRGIVAERRGPG